MDGLDLARGTYRSPRQARSVFSRVSPSLRFYLPFAALVTRCAAMAKRGTYDSHQWILTSLYTMRQLEGAGLRIEVEGLQHLRDVDGPCVLVGNHMSMLETVVLPVLIRPHLPFTYVVKESLVEIPVFKHVLRARSPIVVTRRDPRADFQTMMGEGRKHLAEGTSILVFPQTTRIVGFDREQFNSIGVKLARKARVPLIPFALRTDAWGLSKRFIKDAGRIDPSKPVRFAFGEPIEIAGRGDEAHEQAIAFIEEHLERWGIRPTR